MKPACVWHEVECSGYSADLGAWLQLAEAAEGPVLELGAGSGRVALALARRDHEVWAVDADPDLLEALEERAMQDGLPVRTHLADVRALELDREFDLILAPMQFAQVLGGEAQRREMLGRAVQHLGDDGTLALAIVERPASAAGAVGAAIPDVREFDGWAYSSLSVAAASADGDLEIHRLRQAVSPSGELTEEEHLESLDALDADVLEAEAATVGLRPVERLAVPAAGGYLGSTIVALGAS